MISSSLQGGCEPTFDLLWSPENTKGVVSFEPPLGVTLVSPVDACGFEHLCLVLLVSSNSVPEKESNGYWGGCTKLSCTRVSEYLDLCIVCTSWHFVQKTTQSQPVQNLMFQLSEIFWEYSGFISGNKKIARYRLWIYGQFIFQNEMSFTNLQQLSRFHSAGRWQQFHFGAPCGWWQYWTLGRWSLSKGLSLPDTQEWLVVFCWRCLYLYGVDEIWFD